MRKLPAASVFLLCASGPLAGRADDAPRSRTFDFEYTATVKDLPAGAKHLDLWIPVPPTDARQTVELRAVESPFPFEYQVEPEYGNRILHAWSDVPAAASVTLRFRCTRREHRHLPGSDGEAGKPDLQSPPPERFLRADRLGVVDDRIVGLSNEIAGASPDPFAKSRAIYEHVLAKMVYDKSGTGWGRGDTRHACDVGKGNCTDFHALFISLARAQKIPARFEMGFSIPPDQPEGPVAGYHCWALCWVPDFGWVPVDASEASKNRDKRAYFFGAHDPHRVMCSVGRDITLPGMRGEPLNFFVYPYAEVDGKPHAGVDKAFRFRDVAADPASPQGGAAAPTPAPPAPPKPRGFEFTVGESTIRFYGFVRADLLYDDSHPNNTQTLVAVLSEDPAAPPGLHASNNAGDLTIHARLTRFGVDVSGPPLESLGGATPSGKIEFDFYNNGLLGQSESRAAIRMRHAYLKLGWTDGYALAGQTADIVAPLWPVVNADMVMWGAGNLGDRRPMLMGEYNPGLGAGTLRLQGEIGLTGANDNQNLDGGTRDGEASGLPTLQTRVAWKGPHPWIEKETFEAGVWGHRAWEHLDTPPAGFTKDDFDSHAYGADLTLPLQDLVELRAEVWRGKNVDDIRGGIFQGVSAVNGGEEIRSRGYWVELVFKPLAWYALHLGTSHDNPENGEVTVPGAGTAAPTGAEDNAIHYLANRFDAGGGVTFGLDWMKWKTRWRGGFDEGTDNRHNFFVQYGF